jgi:hypothetical protein
MQPFHPDPFDYLRLAALLDTSHLYVYRREQTVIITHWCAQFCTERNALLRSFQPECEGSFFCWPIAEMGFRPDHSGIEHIWSSRSQVPPIAQFHVTRQAVSLGHGIVY